MKIQDSDPLSFLRKQITSSLSTEARNSFTAHLANRMNYPFDMENRTSFSRIHVSPDRYITFGFSSVQFLQRTSLLSGGTGNRSFSFGAVRVEPYSDHPTVLDLANRIDEILIELRWISALSLLSRHYAPEVVP
jgi:hypothetical protein